MITLDQLVSSNHIYRKFMKLWDLSEIKIELEKIEVTSDHKGYGIFRLFLCLLLQFMEDLSDRELDEAIASNNAFRWFCRFGLTEKTLISEYLLMLEKELELIDYLKYLILLDLN